MGLREQDCFPKYFLLSALVFLLFYLFINFIWCFPQGAWSQSGQACQEPLARMQHGREIQPSMLSLNAR